MSASRLASQYSSFVAPRQFRDAAEDVSYVLGSAASVALKAVVERDINVERQLREDGIWEVQRANVTVLNVVDAVQGGVVLANSGAIQAFRGANFSFPLDEGGTALADWIVKTVSGGPGTWEFGVMREKRTETGKTRRATA